MSSTIELMKSHRSIRKFANAPIAEAELEAILLAASSASSSCYMQCASVIKVSCPDKRQLLAEYAGNQDFVISCAEFLVFCADFNLHQQIVGENIKLGYSEQLIVSAIDAALMGQNALLAAESLGLGGVFIGAIRNNPEKVSELLGLPEHVIPLFGLCLGFPDQLPNKKPRLPLSLRVHDNNYQLIDVKVLAEYDEQVRDYYITRSQGSLNQTWSDQIEQTLKNESRPFMLEFIRSKGFGIW